VEAVVDNEEAEEVSNHKIEDNPNRENIQTVEIFRKPRPISIKRPKHEFVLQVRQIAPRNMSGD
jgi:hypothetical protein